MARHSTDANDFINDGLHKQFVNERTQINHARISVFFFFWMFDLAINFWKNMPSLYKLIGS